MGEKQLDDELATEPQVSEVLILKRNSLCPFLCFNQLEPDNFYFFNQEDHLKWQIIDKDHQVNLDPSFVSILVDP